METVGSRIKKWRKLKNLTQLELGKKINKNVKSIQRYEMGTNPVPIDVLNNIARALNIGIDKLIYNEDDKMEKEKVVAIIKRRLYTISDLISNLEKIDFDDMNLEKLKEIKLNLRNTAIDLILLPIEI
ncbi:MAG: helix-turn-helix transcriptional regulator [Bacteroidota bacterium]|nr:helix-turn-helix transcriptional regulator [Bacteroidota bacterium]